MDNTEQLTCLSLCTGYGGIELGLERAGIRLRPIAYVEREAFAAANLVAKIEAGEVAPAPVWTDVKTFPFADFRGRVGIMLAGYPCQPFSAAGQRKGAADERHLWPHIAAGIAACQPRFVFCENVEGHLSLGIKNVFNDLDRLGYSYTAGLFSAEEVGATHRRKRLFWLAELADSSSKGLEGFTRHEQDAARQEGAGTNRPTAKSGFSLFPAGPGQPQHGWEEPRTVGNAGGAEPDRLPDEARPDVSEVGQSGGAMAVANAVRRNKREDNQRRQPPKRNRLETASQRKTESELGGATDGPGSRPDAIANRVDRLRLLGNGVVPQTAAKAFTTLWQQLKN